MSSAGQIGYTGHLQYDSGGGVYVSLAECMDIKGPGIKVDSIEVTSNDSSNGAKEFIPGLADCGEVTVTLVYVKSTLTTLYGFYRTNKNWRVLWADSSTWSFSGFWTSLESSSPVDDKITVDLTVKLTGKPTFA